jgi:hypothetical protein
MKNLTELLQELITEAKVTPSIMSDWVTKKKIIRIKYKGEDDDPVGLGIRFIEPHAMGISPKGFVAIRAYQAAGATTTYTPEWKIFRVDRFISWEDTGQRFTSPRPKFNPSGDKTFKKVYFKSKF